MGDVDIQAILLTIYSTAPQSQKASSLAGGKTVGGLSPSLRK